MKIKEKGWFLIGCAAVDSGQLLLVDPGYLSAWVDNDAPGHEIIEDTWTGKRYQLMCRESERVIGVQVFSSYAEIIPAFGKDMNALLETDRFKRIAWKYPLDLSYRGACMASGLESGGGQAGLGVCFSSGYGDGCYKVWGRKNKDGRIVEVKVLMGEE